MLRLHTLGQVFLERGGVRVLGGAAQPRRIAVLAVLAAAGTRGVSRERLVALLWPDTDEDRARRALNQALYALRQEIGSDDGIAGTRELSIAPELVRSDVGEFRAAVAAGAHEKAVAVYGGAFLEGFHLPGLDEFERWVELERARLARDHATSLERLATSAEERGEHAAAAAWWQRLAAADPLDGRTTLRLMQALVGAGDRVGALRQARVYELLLSRELELPPDAEVLDLAERIRQSEPVAGSGAGTVAVTRAEPAAPATEAAATEGAETDTAVDASDESSDVASDTSPADATLDREPTVRTPQRLRQATQYWLAATGAALLLVLFAAIGAWRTDPDVPVLGAARKITFDAGLELDPALSPDGQWLAYVAGPEGTMRVFVRRVDGGRSIGVSGDVPGDHRRPRWSPDGSRLLFQADGSIWLVPALGGTPRAVVRGPDDGVRALYPDWSPDGSELVWVQRDSLFVRAVSGGRARFVAVLPEAHSLAWSPDGRWIAAVSRNEGFVYGAGASMMQVGFINLGNLAPSGVWLVPARGGEPVPVVNDDQLNTSPEWIDRKRLVFISDRDGTRDVFLVPIDRAGMPTSPLVRLTTGLNAHTVAVRRNGAAMAYSVYTHSSNVWALPIPDAAPVGTAGAAPITRGTQTVEGLEVSPDGRWLAFDADGGGSQDIYRLPLEGGEIERVVESPTNEHRPSWAPDGSSLLFYSFIDGVRRAFTVPADGGQPAPLQRDGRETQHTPVWSPDMRRILYHRWMGEVDQIFEIARLPDSTWSAERQLTRNGGFGPRWSPDGKLLAYIAPQQVRLMQSEPDGETHARVLYDFSNATSTTPRPVAIRWHPDGRTLYMKTFDALGAAAIWSLSLEGGSPVLLVRFDEAHRPTRRPEFTTDGRRFFFTLAQSESDVWVITVR